jgi:hypothetical protein
VALFLAAAPVLCWLLAHVWRGMKTRLGEAGKLAGRSNSPYLIRP